MTILYDGTSHTEANKCKQKIDVTSFWTSVAQVFAQIIPKAEHKLLSAMRSSTLSTVKHQLTVLGLRTPSIVADT